MADRIPNPVSPSRVRPGGTQRERADLTIRDRGLAGRMRDDDLAALYERYAQHRDPADLARLVDEHSDLAAALARRFYRHRESLDDLRQVAYEALLGAARRFDPAYGTPFAPFAVATIAGALKRHYRDSGWAMRVPRAVHELIPTLRHVSDELTQRHGRTPTIAELANALHVAEDDLIAALAADTTRQVDSIDAPPGPGPTCEPGRLDDAFAVVEARESLRTIVQSLPEEDRRLVQLYFFDGLSQAQIAKRLGVSQMQISRLLRGVLDRIRTGLTPEDRLVLAGA